MLKSMSKTLLKNNEKKTFKTYKILYIITVLVELGCRVRLVYRNSNGRFLYSDHWPKLRFGDGGQEKAEV